jgi:hypothetical protein
MQTDSRCLCGVIPLWPEPNTLRTVSVWCVLVETFPSSRRTLLPDLFIISLAGPRTGVLSSSEPVRLEPGTSSLTSKHLPNSASSSTPTPHRLSSALTKASHVHLGHASCVGERGLCAELTVCAIMMSPTHDLPLCLLVFFLYVPDVLPSTWEFYSTHAGKSVEMSSDLLLCLSA